MPPLPPELSTFKKDLAVNTYLPSNPFVSIEDEISSLNFGLQDDISIKKFEVEFYQFMSQICEEYGLGIALQQYSIFLATDVQASFTSQFSEVFVLDEDTQEKLYFVNRSLYIYASYMRDVFDERETLKVDAHFLASLLRDHAFERLNGLFPSSSDFWAFAKKYQRRAIAAIIQERTKWNKPTSYSLDEAFNIASGKASIVQMMIVALACLSDSPELIQPLEKSLEAFFQGLQFHSDLKNWRTDFMTGRYSYLLSQIIDRKKLQEKLESVTLEELARMIYFTGLAEEILDHVIDCYRQALSYVHQVPCTDWKMAIDNSISETSVLLRNLQKYKEQEIDRVSKLVMTKKNL